MRALELAHQRRVARLRVTLRRQELDAISAASLVNDTGTVTSTRLWYAARARYNHTAWQIKTMGQYRYP